MTDSKKDSHSTLCMLSAKNGIAPQKSSIHSIMPCLLPMILYLLLFPALFTPPVNAREKGAGKEGSTIKVSVNLVLVKVGVTDRSGSPIKGLTEKDFEVFDNGKPQKILTFASEFEGSDAAHDEKQIRWRSNATTETKDEIPGRLISIFIDDLTPYSLSDFPRMVERIRVFIEKDLGANDQMAILSGSRRIQFPFTNDKNALLEELSSISGRLDLSIDRRSDIPKLSDLKAWIIASAQAVSAPGITNQSNASAELLRLAAKRHDDEMQFRTHSLMQSLRQHIRAIRRLEGPKSLVLFSDGFLAEPGMRATYELQDIIGLALNSGVKLNAVNIRTVSSTMNAGINQNEPFSDANAAASPADDDMDRAAQENSLLRMASDTGGLFFHNGIYEALKDIAQRESCYYVLSYGMPSQTENGTYHNITVKVARPNLQLSYRKGYYTSREELSFESRKKEDILEAINGPADMKEIPVTVAYNFFQVDDSSYAVSFLTGVDIKKLQFAEEDSRRTNTLNLVLVAFDEMDRFVSGLEKSIVFRLQESSYQNLLKDGLISRVELTLPVGRYKVKAVAREHNQGKIGSIARIVEIP